jgi:hypothetical protein
MQYLTYSEYVEIGGVLDETAFKRTIDRACGFIRNETFNRIEHMRHLPDEVKPCCRDLVEYMANNLVTKAAVSSKSQSAGGVSESESYAVKTLDDAVADMQSIVFDYLGSITDDYFVPLLYRGGGRT